MVVSAGRFIVTAISIIVITIMDIILLGILNKSTMPKTYKVIIVVAIIIISIFIGYEINRVHYMF